VWWLARGEDDLPAGTDWLTPREARRYAEMRFPKRRIEYLLRRSAAKHAVAAVAGLPVDRPGLARIDIANAPSGAPYVLIDGAPAAVDVSVTDRAGWAVCLAGSGTFGCDLELVEPRSAGFVADFLTAAERDHVAAQPDPDARHAAANLMWSAKESALKVLKTGLRRDTRSVEVTIHSASGPGWHPLTVRDVTGPVFPGWWRRDGQFLLTVAGAVPAPPPVALEHETVLAAARPVHSWMAWPAADSPRRA
jgi:4'-phosphopantetheinyl transferase